MNGHRSSANNINDHQYDTPFHRALRKYGEENFSFEILEEIDEELGRDYLNEREIFYIQKYKTYIRDGGYNLTLGGDGNSRDKLTFEECCARSKILTKEEIIDIQEMLIDGYQYFEIKEKYPKLGDSFLQTINLGLNFYRNDLSYPLASFHTKKYTKKQMEEIREKIAQGIPYSIISNEYNISRSYLSQINTGTRWHNDMIDYPLYKK